MHKNHTKKNKPKAITETKANRETKEKQRNNPEKKRQRKIRLYILGLRSVSLHLSTPSSSPPPPPPTTTTTTTKTTPARNEGKYRNGTKPLRAGLRNPFCAVRTPLQDCPHTLPNNTTLHHPPPPPVYHHPPFHLPRHASFPLTPLFHLCFAFVGVHTLQVPFVVFSFSFILIYSYIFAFSHIPSLLTHSTPNFLPPRPPTRFICKNIKKNKNKSIHFQNMGENDVLHPA